jgi:hypothetical protein
VPSEEEFDVFAIGSPGPPAPAAMSVPGDSAGMYDDLPLMADMRGFMEPEEAGGSDCDILSEASEHFSGDAGSEMEEEDENNNETPGRASVNWEEVRGPAEYEIDSFCPDVAPGINHNLDSESPSLEFFYLVFPETFFQHVVDETNTFARHNRAVNATIAAVSSGAFASGEGSSAAVPASDGGSDNSWTDTTLPEIKAYIAMNIAMGLRGHTAMKDIWSIRSSLHDAYLSKIISRDRFSALSKYFHIADYTGAVQDYRDPNYDPMHKVRPMIDLFNTRAPHLYRPKQHLSVDEAMIAFKGRHHAKQYMPKKPIKRGFKVWVCAESDTGYALKVEVYEGKARTDARIQQRSEYGMGYDVVMELIQAYQGKNHVISFDRFFSSVTLAEHLLQRKTYMNSTVLMTRKGLPIAAKKLRLKAGAPCHQYRKGQLLLTLFYGKRQVCHLSTGSLPGLNDSGIKPIVNEDYNNCMGGVDLCDQHGSYYPVGRKTVKWWKYIVWYFINLAINNAYVLYRAAPSPIVTGDEPHLKRLKTHKEFRVEIIEQLVGTVCQRGGIKRRRPSSDEVLMDMAVGLSHTAETSQHLRLCQYCPKKSGKKVRTMVWCKDCTVNLCPLGCFQRYHAERCGISQT